MAIPLATPGTSAINAILKTAQAQLISAQTKTERTKQRESQLKIEDWISNTQLRQKTRDRDLGVIQQDIDNAGLRNESQRAEWMANVDKNMAESSEAELMIAVDSFAGLESAEPGSPTEEAAFNADVERYSRFNEGEAEQLRGKYSPQMASDIRLRNRAAIENLDTKRRLRVQGEAIKSREDIANKDRSLRRYSTEMGFAIDLLKMDQDKSKSLNSFSDKIAKNLELSTSDILYINADQTEALAATVAATELGLDLEEAADLETAVGLSKSVATRSRTRAVNDMRNYNKTLFLKGDLRTPPPLSLDEYILEETKSEVAYRRRQLEETEEPLFGDKEVGTRTALTPAEKERAEARAITARPEVGKLPPEQRSKLLQKIQEKDPRFQFSYERIQ